MKLSERVFEFECEISNEQALEFEVDIDKLKTLEDVKLYYLYERGWISDDSLVDLLFDFIIDLKKEQIISFAEWYSGMEKEKVERAYQRYLNETFKKE